MSYQRKLGFCADPSGTCVHTGQEIELYMGLCRKCYDRLRNSNPKNKETMPDLGSVATVREDRVIAAGRAKLFEAFSLLQVSDEDKDAVLKILARYFREVMEQLYRERADLDKII